MIETAFQNAEEFGFRSGDIVQEWLWDDDVDDSIREKIEQLTGEELVDEDYDSAVDGVIIWWRDGDDEDELADTIVDAYAVLGDDGAFKAAGRLFIWLTDDERRLPVLMTVKIPIGSIRGELVQFRQGL